MSNTESDRPQGKGAIIGFVNTEEVTVKKIKQQNPNVQIDGYLLAPNKAFSDACDNSKLVNDNYLQQGLVSDLQDGNYDFVYVGPLPALYAVSGILIEGNIEHIGATVTQAKYEDDKTTIFDLFPFPLNVLPPTEILNKYNPEEIKKILDQMGGQYVLKFVGDYTQKYRGSETGRVRIGNETVRGTDEALRFIQDSIDVSGKAIIQKRIDGQDFSANFLLDKNSNSLRLGENICYKRRNNGDTGPMCDATGSASVNNTLPFLDNDERDFIQEEIVGTFSSKMKEVTGQPYVGMVNLDLIKSRDGKIYLLEVNCRQAGGHTMANILSGLETSLFDALRLTQSGNLDQIRPNFKNGASVVASAFPGYFPEDTQPGEDKQVIEVTKHIPSDINVYTGWVDVLAEDANKRELRLYNSPSLLFEHFNKDVTSARERLYEVMKSVIDGRLDYRTDIGQTITSL